MNRRIDKNEANYVIMIWKEKLIKSYSMDDKLRNSKPHRQNKAISCMAYVLWNIVFNSNKKVSTH